MEPPMRKLRLVTAWTLGTIILILAVPPGLVLGLLHWVLSLVGPAVADGCDTGNRQIRKTQRWLGSRFYHPLMKLARRIHPDGGGSYV
jgi:hypothetical protein